MLIAIVILSISLLALAGLMVTTTRNNSFGNHMTEAATFAQDKLEELRVTDWNLIIPNTTTTDQRTGSTGNVYIRRWTAVPNNPFPNDTMKTITISINWNDGVDHTISHVSAITR